MIIGMGESDSILYTVYKALYACGVEEDTTLLLALSGGADSMALLHILHGLLAQNAFKKLVAAHLHHGIREEADEDAAFVSAFCEKMQIPCIVERVDVPALRIKTGNTLEEAAREARYAFLKKARAQAGADFILTAHHMEDQAETVLLHLLRGSGLAGLCGMRMRERRLLRPLLYTKKEALNQYVEENGIAYKTDHSNFDTHHTRNKIRLELLPLLKEAYNPNIMQGLCDMARLLCEDEAYLMGTAQRALRAAALPGGNGAYRREKLAALPRPVQSRAIRIALGRAGALYDMQQGGIENICRLLTGRTGACRDLPRGLCAWTSYGTLYIGRRAQARQIEETPFFWPGEVRTAKGRFVSTYTKALKKNEGATVAYLDADKLPAGTVVRQRRPGDRFYPLGAPGGRKLKEYLIDKKIPREDRLAPLLACGDEVLFFPGGVVSERVKVTDHTRHILRVAYIAE